MKEKIQEKVRKNIQQNISLIKPGSIVLSSN
jgi:hypothetical protein